MKPLPSEISIPALGTLRLVRIDATRDELPSVYHTGSGQFNGQSIDVTCHLPSAPEFDFESYQVAINGFVRSALDGYQAMIKASKNLIRRGCEDYNQGDQFSLLFSRITTDVPPTFLMYCPEELNELKFDMYSIFPDYARYEDFFLHFDHEMKVQEIRFDG